MSNPIAHRPLGPREGDFDRHVLHSLARINDEITDSRMVTVSHTTSLLKFERLNMFDLNICALYCILVTLFPLRFPFEIFPLAKYPAWYKGLAGRTIACHP